MTDPRRRLYQAAATVLVLLVPLAWLKDAGPVPAADDPMTVALEDLLLMVAMGSEGDARAKLATVAAGRVPSHAGLAWLRPLVATELGVASPGRGPAPATPDARAIVSLYAEQPSEVPPHAEIVGAIERAIPHPYLRLLVTVRAHASAGREAEAEQLRREARRRASIAVARSVVASSWFVLLLLLGSATLVAAVARRPTATEPPIAPGDALGVFLVWWALHLTMLLLLGDLAARLTGSTARILLLATGYVAVGAVALVLASRWVCRGAGTTLAAIFGLRAEGRLVLAGFAGLAAAVPVMSAAVVVARLLPGAGGGSTNPLLPALLRGDAALKVLLAVLVAVAAPVVEESLFRGLLFPALRSVLGTVAAVAGSGLLFAVAHGDLPVLVPLWALGCVLAYLRHRSGSIVPGMVTHALWNLQTMAVVLLLLGPMETG